MLHTISPTTKPHHNAAINIEPYANVWVCSIAINSETIPHIHRAVASNYKEKLNEAYKGTAPFRINHVSWWKEELASDKEKINGFKNLEKHNYNVDFIVSHCCSTSTQYVLGGGLYKPDHETDYLDEVRAKTEFKKWFFGHYHVNRNVNDKEICIYEQIIRIL